MAKPDVTSNRFEKTTKCFTCVHREVWILEDWLNIHPFPKYKHGYKHILNLLNSQ